MYWQASQNESETCQNTNERWTNTNLDCAIYMVISEFGYHENWRVREV